MKELNYTGSQLQTALYAKALAHPARVFIMEKLNRMNGCCTSGEMIGDVPIARSTLSQHLKELKYAGLIQGEIEGPFIKYCIHPGNWNLAKQMFSALFTTNDSL